MALFTESNFKKVLDPGNITGINDPEAAPIPFQQENQATAQQYLARLGQYNEQYNKAQADENALGRYFQRVLAGQGPSVVGQQINATQDQLARQQQSQVAGTSGVNAAAARREAMQNTAQAQAQANQTAALARTQEQADAAKMATMLRANQAAQAGQMFGTNTTGATGFANIAAGGAAKQADVNQAELAAQRQHDSNLMNAIGTGAALYAKSDERSKTNIEKVKDPEMDAFIKHLSGFTFDYKNPADGDGHRVGVMAQDVQKGGPIGKNMVVGDKSLNLDVGNGLGAALGAIGYLAKRVKELEGRRA